MTVTDLPNLGPVSARMLADVGIETAADLERAGAVLAYRAVRDRHSGATLSFLYALHGALTGQRWDRLAADVKAELKREAAEAGAWAPRAKRGRAR